jgi:hypothetical protein
MSVGVGVGSVVGAPITEVIGSFPLHVKCEYMKLTVQTELDLKRPTVHE